jgi:hypothetical protein
VLEQSYLNWWANLNAELQRCPPANRKTLYDLLEQFSSAGNGWDGWTKLGILHQCMQINEPRDVDDWHRANDDLARGLFGRADARTRQLIPVMLGRTVGRSTEALRCMLVIVQLEPGWEATKPFATFAPYWRHPFRGYKCIIRTVKNHANRLFQSMPGNTLTAPSLRAPKPGILPHRLISAHNLPSGSDPTVFHQTSQYHFAPAMQTPVPLPVLPTTTTGYSTPYQPSRTIASSPSANAHTRIPIPSLLVARSTPAKIGGFTPINAPTVARATLEKTVPLANMKRSRSPSPSAMLEMLSERQEQEPAPKKVKMSQRKASPRTAESTMCLIEQQERANKDTNMSEIQRFQQLTALATAGRSRKETAVPIPEKYLSAFSQRSANHSLPAIQHIVHRPVATPSLDKQPSPKCGFPDPRHQFSSPVAKRLANEQAACGNEYGATQIFANNDQASPLPSTAKVCSKIEDGQDEPDMTAQDALATVEPPSTEASLESAQAKLISNSPTANTSKTTKKTSSHPGMPTAFSRPRSPAAFTQSSLQPRDNTMSRPSPQTPSRITVNRRATPAFKSTASCREASRTLARERSESRMFFSTPECDSEDDVVGPREVEEPYLPPASPLARQDDGSPLQPGPVPELMSFDFEDLELSPTPFHGDDIELQDDEGNGQEDGEEDAHVLDCSSAKMKHLLSRLPRNLDIDICTATRAKDMTGVATKSKKQYILMPVLYTLPQTDDDADSEAWCLHILIRGNPSVADDQKRLPCLLLSLCDESSLGPITASREHADVRSTIVCADPEGRLKMTDIEHHAWRSGQAEFKTIGHQLTPTGADDMVSSSLLLLWHVKAFMADPVGFLANRNIVSADNDPFHVDAESIQAFDSRAKQAMRREYLRVLRHPEPSAKALGKRPARHPPAQSPSASPPRPAKRQRAMSRASLLSSTLSEIERDVPEPVDNTDIDQHYLDRHVIPYTGANVLKDWKRSTRQGTRQGMRHPRQQAVVLQSIEGPSGSAMNPYAARDSE